MKYIQITKRIMFSPLTLLTPHPSPTPPLPLPFGVGEG